MSTHKQFIMRFGDVRPVMGSSVLCTTGISVFTVVISDLSNIRTFNLV